MRFERGIATKQWQKALKMNRLGNFKAQGWSRQLGVISFNYELKLLGELLIPTDTMSNTRALWRYINKQVERRRRNRRDNWSEGSRMLGGRRRIAGDAVKRDGPALV